MQDIHSSSQGDEGLAGRGQEAPSLQMVQLQVSTVGKLNLADFQNAVPALHELVIVNETSDVISDEAILSMAREIGLSKPRAANRARLESVLFSAGQ